MLCSRENHQRKNLERQLPGGVQTESFSEKFCKFDRKVSLPELNTKSLQTANLKTRLQNRCISVDFAIFQNSLSIGRLFMTGYVFRTNLSVSYFEKRKVIKLT